jgi:DNA-binding transcriptional ArsR family regulator
MTHSTLVVLGSGPRRSPAPWTRIFRDRCTGHSRPKGHYSHCWIQPLLYSQRVETATYGQVLARFGHALSDPTRARLLLALREEPGYPAELAELLGVTRQNLSNHLGCLRGCGLVVAVPEGRRTRYELADPRLGHALGDLLGLVLVTDPAACPTSPDADCC